MRLALVVLMTLMLALGLVQTGRAACASPVGEAGEVIYASGIGAFQGCDGTNWKNLTLSGGDTDPCINPTGVAGTLIYNNSTKVLQACNGNGWQNLGNANVGGGSGPCSNPSGAEGTVIHNTTVNKFQYCNGNGWVNVGTWVSAGVGAASFTPDNIAGLQFWFKADAIASPSGTTLTSLLDSSAQSISITSVNTAQTITGNGIGTMPALRMTGSGNYRTTQSITLDDFHFFIVFRDFGNAVAYERLIDMDYINGFWVGRNGSNASSFGGGVQQSGPPYGIFASFTDGAAHLISRSRSDTTHSLFANGSLASSGTVPTTAFSRQLGIGGWYNNGTPGQNASNIMLGEILIYNNFLTEAQRQQIEGYLAHKWGLTGSLPSGHPYKSVAP